MYAAIRYSYSVKAPRKMDHLETWVTLAFTYDWFLKLCTLICFSTFSFVLAFYLNLLAVSLKKVSGVFACVIEIHFI